MADDTRYFQERRIPLQTVDEGSGVIEVALVAAMDDIRGISVTQSQSAKILGEAMMDILKNAGHIPKGEG